MKLEGKGDEWLQRLRNKAEKVLSAEGSESLCISIDDAEKLIHEISVYHVELELQNQELQNVQELLEISRNKYYELFDMAPMGYFTVDATGVVKEVNLGGGELVGLERSAIKRMPFVGFVVQADHRRLYEFFRHTLTAGTAPPLYIRMKKTDGTLLDAQVESALLASRRTDKHRMLLSVTDISALRQAQRVIAESESQFRSLVEFSADHIFLLSTDGEYLASNDRGGHFGLLRGDQLVGLNLENAHAPDTARLYRRKLQEVLAHNAAVTFAHQPNAHATEPCHHIVTLYPIDENGCISRVGGICRDVTEVRKAEREKRELEQKLAQSQKMEAIGLLAGGIAHDFNNLLSSIMGFTELCMDGVETESETLKYLEKVRDASNRAKTLVQQILTFSRKTEHDLRPIDPVPVMVEAVRFLRHTLPSSIVIAQKISGTPMRINSNPAQLHQIIFNIGTNAAHAMENEKGTISIHIDRKNVDGLPDSIIDLPFRGDCLVMEIADDGVGMARDVIKKIFDPYFTTKDVGKGTGLGLSVVLGIVKGHGGGIRVKSDPGKGTVFSVYIPCIRNLPDERPTFTPDSRQAADTDLSGKHVVVVDDEASVLKMTTSFLQKSGCRVVAFLEAEKALAYLNENIHDIDLLMTDKTMPGMTGSELAASVKTLRPDIPVVMNSGYIAPSNENEGLKIIDAFLQKPYSRQDLHASLAAAMQSKGPPKTSAGH